MLGTPKTVIETTVLLVLHHALISPLSDSLSWQIGLWTVAYLGYAAFITAVARHIGLYGVRSNTTCALCSQSRCILWRAPGFEARGCLRDRLVDQGQKDGLVSWPSPTLRYYGVRSTSYIN